MGSKISEKNNFYFLTVALISLLVSSAFQQVLSSGLLELLLQFVTVLNFIVCLVSLRFDKKWYRFFLTLLVCWLLVAVARQLMDIKRIDVVMLLLTFTFFLGTFISIFRQILMTGSIDRNKVIGSVALFLLLGLMWAILYLLILEFLPNAFTGMTQLPWGDNFSNAAYFSFVTLTTLGYGDISPISPVAQVVVYLEAIVGVFYMAIVVASLVGASQSNQDKSNVN